MKTYVPALFIGAAIVAIAVSTVSVAQPRPAERQDNTLRLKKGEQYLVHASDDTVIELYVDMPITETEKLKYINISTGKSYLLPNGANIRLQGNVLIARDAEGSSVAEPQIRWRYVDTIFASYSRPR